MTGKKSTKCTCPICKNSFERSAASFPFCSDRCKQIDLGAWASGKYVVTGGVVELDSAQLTEDGDESDPSQLLH